jgi:hypothetical protein
MIDEGDIPSIQCKMSLRGPKSMKKVDWLSLISTDYYVPNSESELLYDGQFTANQFVLAPSPLRPSTSISLFN